MRYINHVWEYLQAEHKEKRGCDLAPTRDDWDLVPCIAGNPLAATQGPRSNDCGVYSCMFMDLLMSNVDPALLQNFEREILADGRVVLWQAMQNRKAIFDVTLRQT